MSDFGLHTLKPAPGSRKTRKRVGRGEGSGMGKTSGRGENGYGSRSGAKDRARFEGGQMPIHMRMRKLRGPNKKQSMPFEPFRTHTQAVNLKDLEARFDKGADVTLEALRDKGLGTRKGIPVKILAKGEITKSLTVHAHAFTALLLGLYRLGSHIPVPGVDVKAVNAVQKQFGGGGVLNLLNTFSGGGLSRIA